MAGNHGVHHEREGSCRRVFGMVNGAPGLVATPAVIDGCPDLLIAVFGPKIGAHTRSAIGVAELPGDMPVEIEAVIAIRD